MACCITGYALVAVVVVASGSWAIISAVLEKFNFGLVLWTRNLIFIVSQHGRTEGRRYPQYHGCNWYAPWVRVAPIQYHMDVRANYLVFSFFSITLIELSVVMLSYFCSPHACFRFYCTGIAKKTQSVGWTLWTLSRRYSNTWHGLLSLQADRYIYFILSFFSSLEPFFIPSVKPCIILHHK